jgi:hypothetical protein
VSINKAVYYIYFHRRIDNGQVFYVGKGVGNRAYTRNSRNDLWHNVADTIGFNVEIIEKDLLQDLAYEREIYYIALFGKDNLCNKTIGGGSPGSPCSDARKLLVSKQFKGKKKQPMSQETKDKLSAAKKGKICSEETKLKLSKALKGRVAPNKGISPSKETIKKRSESLMGHKGYWLGKTHSEDTRKKISEKLKGKVVTDETKKKISDSKRERDKQKSIAAALTAGKKVFITYNDL